MAKFLKGRIEIPLQRARNDKGEYHIGEWGDVGCELQLSDIKFLVFPSKDKPGHFTLIIDEKNRKG